MEGLGEEMKEMWKSGLDEMSRFLSELGKVQC